MKIKGLSSYDVPSYQLNDAASIIKALEAAAARHNTTVEELLEEAAIAGPGGPMYLVRVLNLKRRLDRLESK